MASVRPRNDRRRSGLWLLITSLGVTLASVGASCRSSEGTPVDPATAPASSAERALARAQRQARTRARSEQTARPEPAPAKPPRPPEPEPEPDLDLEPAPEPEPGEEAETEPSDAGAPDASDAGDAAPAQADAGPKDPAELCAELCGKVIDCMTSMFGGGNLPPGVDEDEIRSRLSQECLDECMEDIEEQRREATACLEIDDCAAFLDCVKNIDD